MQNTSDTGGDARIRIWDTWLPAVLCYSVILATVPVARSVQVFVYKTIGKDFYTYFVIVSVITLSLLLLYYLFFRLRARNRSQYVWILVCAGFYIFNTFQLRKHPEEALHLLEYGILAYFIFRALSRSVPDWTVYLSSLLLVLFAGTADEFLQWLIPKRVWSFSDVRLNVVAGGISLLGIWQGIRPASVDNPVRKMSVRIFIGIITANLLFIGLCLSNTPDAVGRYTAAATSLSWLRNEEVMSEYGYVYKDREIGTFYSRFSIEELEETDSNKGMDYGETLRKDIDRGADLDDLSSAYNRYTDIFLYEFLIHVSRRDNNLLKTIGNDKTEETRSAFIALKEILILERYFGNTLDHSGLQISDEVKGELKVLSSSWEEDYSSYPGARLITSFSLGTVWIVFPLLCILVWITYGIWTNTIKNQR